MKRHAIFGLVVMLGGLMVAANLVWAQSGDCGGASGCVDSSQFDSAQDMNGWYGPSTGPYSATVISWMAEKEYGALWWRTYAEGVVKADGISTPVGSGDIHKVLSLAPGYYHLVFRASTDVGLVSEPLVVVKTANDNDWTAIHPAAGDYFNLNQEWRVYVSQVFTVTELGDVEISFSAKSQLYDYIYLIQDSTWLGTGTPVQTLTPIPATSTPIAVGTAYCVVQPTATPTGQAVFGTPTVTPTPATFAYRDTFDVGALAPQWSIIGSGVEVYLNTGHFGSGAAKIPNSVLTETMSNRNVLVYNYGEPITSTFFFDGWVKEDFSQSGVEYYLQIYVYDVGYQLWTQVGSSIAIDSSNWQPFHVEINFGSYGMVSAIGITASRSDSGLNGWAYLDDVFIYQPETNGPHCDGTYPPSTNFSEPSNTFSVTYGIYVPQSKPCPGPINKPNNFWGELFSQLTYLLDTMFASTPYHNAGTMRGLAQMLLFNPIGGIVVFFAGLFDFTLMLQAFIAMLIVQGVYLLILGWKFLRRSTVQ